METLITIAIIYAAIAILTLIVLLMNLNIMGREEHDTAVAIGMSILFPITFIILIYEWIKDSIHIHHIQKRQSLFDEEGFKVVRQNNKIYIDTPEQSYVINTDSNIIKSNKPKRRHHLWK